MNITDIIEKGILPRLKQPLWGRWYIKNRLGIGTFSMVYRIEADSPGGKEVSALKIEAITANGKMFTDKSMKRSYLENLHRQALNEAKIMKDLADCPYVVRYEDELTHRLCINGELEGYYNLIRMEFLENVVYLINAKKFDLSEKNVKKLAYEIGQGLKAAHDIGVIHRDIKPDNMFVSTKGVYKLGDFNIAKKADSTRSFAGTSGYIAPEIYRAGASARSGYTNQADIYSLGICLYQMMNNGLFPFEGKLPTEEAVDLRMTGRPLPPPVNASKSFGDVILRACAFNTADRYKNMSEMLNDVNRCIKNVNTTIRKTTSVKASVKRPVGGTKTVYADQPWTGGSAPAPAPAPHHTRAPKSRHSSVTALIVIVAAMLLTGLMLYFISTKGGSDEDKDKDNEPATAVTQISGDPPSADIQ